MFHRQDKKNNSKDKDLKNNKIPSSLNDTTAYIKELYHLPINKDVMIRDLFLGGSTKKAFLLFINTISDTKIIEDSLLQPLLQNKDPLKNIEDIVCVSSIEEICTIGEAVQETNKGNTILFIEGSTSAYSFSTAKFLGRNIDKAEDEVTLKGPKEAFTETVMTNVNLVRKKIKDENLIFEAATVSERANNTLFITYIKDLTNEETLQKVRDKLNQLNPATLQNLSILEEYMDENPHSIFPTILYTERPDRAAGYLNDGHIVILMENSPASLILPVTFWSFIHSPDDQYLRLVFGNFVRFLRAIAIFVTIFTSAAYVAVTNYHSSMIPPDLLMAIAATREKVPFPALVEILVMELAFELIREAGLRVPSPIGPTIGIVGALILGQSAVQANIVSPIVVIVVALSGLSSFVVGDISMNFAIRSTRIFFIVAAGMFGIYGMAVVFAAGMFYLVTLKSYGVPYLAPFTPKYSSSKNVMFRRLIQKEAYRPEHIKPKDLIKK